MRQQNVLNFKVGIFIGRNPSDVSRVARGLATAATYVCGGCTYSTDKTGTWIEEAGRTSPETFDVSAMVTEYVVEIELTCEPDKTEAAYKHMKDACAVWVKKGFDINWVHCTQTIALGRHFSVSEHIAEQEA